MPEVKNNPTLYQGRFAPSPTGPLHLGSLLTALGSYLQAKSQNGNWFVRIDDIDPPREMKGATSSILHTLENFGLYWDGDVIYQSKRHELYEQALEILDSKTMLYPCSCSRKQIKETASTGPIGYVYPGTCRNKLQPLNSDTSSSQYANQITCPDSTLASNHLTYLSSGEKKPFFDKNTVTRLKTNEVIEFEDFLQGQIEHDLQKQVGDVVLKRADGLYAYHLAAVVDDYNQNITEIVRGIDLLNCTPIQIYLQQLLTYQTPGYLHLPILVNQNSEKLSKQTKAEAVSTNHIEQTLFNLLTLLNQNPPKDIISESKTDILNWAIAHWKTQKLMGIKEIKLS